MAAHESPEVPVPRLLPGKAVHDDETEGCQAGRELYALSIELMHLETPRQADWWVERYLQWCSFWADFLEDVSYVDGRRVFTHEKAQEGEVVALETRLAGNALYLP